MARKAKDHTGLTYGRLLVLNENLKLKNIKKENNPYAKINFGKLINYET